MFHNDVQTINSDNSCQVGDNSWVGLNIKFANGVQRVSGSHVVRVVSGHSNQIKLELLVKLLPLTVFFILWIGVKLKSSTNAI